MKNFKFIKRKITEKEINIKAKNELEALDLFIEIQEKTDILDMNNTIGKCDSFEITIEESNVENSGDYNMFYDDNDDECYDYSDEVEDEIENLCKKLNYNIKIEKN